MQGQLDEAAARLRESLRLEPEQLASPYYLALVARDQGRDAEAIEGLEELLRRHPDHASSCEALGGLLMNGGRYAEAERLLRRAIELSPKSVKANYQLGLLLARTGRREEADKQLAMAKSLREEDDETSRLQLRAARSRRMKDRSIVDASVACLLARPRPGGDGERPRAAEARGSRLRGRARGGRQA